MTAPSHPAASVSETSDGISERLNRLDEPLAGLFSPGRLRLLGKALSELPPDLSRYWGLEWKEGCPPGVYLSIRAGSPGQALLAERDPSSGLPATWRAESGWPQVTRFARFWQDSGLVIPHVGLGLEARTQAEAPLPFLHARTDRCSASEILALILPLAGVSETEQTESALRRCIDAMVPTYVGTRYDGSDALAGQASADPRPSGALRITQLISVEEAASYLREIGWPGARRVLEGTLNLAAAWTTHVGLSLDVGETVEPYLGIELLNWTRPVADTATWSACLTELGERRLLPMEVCTALLHSARVMIPLPGRTGEGRQLLACRPHHLKLVAQESDTPEVKAYLDVIERDVFPREAPSSEPASA